MADRINMDTWEITRYIPNYLCEFMFTDSKEIDSEKQKIHKTDEARIKKCSHPDNAHATEHCCYDKCPIKKSEKTTNVNHFNFDKCYGF